MSYSIHASEGTPDLIVGTDRELADQHPDYAYDEYEDALPGDELPRLFIFDDGNQEGWVFELPNGSEDLYAFARQLEQLGDRLAIRERSNTGNHITIEETP